MLAGEDFILRRAAQVEDGARREVIVRLAEHQYVDLIDASRRYRQTPGALALDYIVTGLADVSGTMKAIKFAREEPDEELVHQLAAERAKVRELEAAVANMSAQPAAADETTIRHLMSERDGWKKTAEDLRESLRETRTARDELLDQVEALQIKNDQLLTELASCARPLPPIITVTAAPERSPELNETNAERADKAVTELLNYLKRGPEPYGLDRKAAEEAPSAPDAPLTPAFIKAVVGYNWAGVSVEQIARSLRCDEHQVRRALKAKRRAS
jgi:hypothetical protein